MALHYFFAYGKSYPGSFVFFSAVKPLKGIENPVQVFLVKSDAVIFDQNEQAIWLALIAAEGSNTEIDEIISGIAQQIQT